MGEVGGLLSLYCQNALVGIQGGSDGEQSRHGLSKPLPYTCSKLEAQLMVQFMSIKSDAVWSPQANNQYYRITELILPASESTGLLRFEFRTIFLPHAAGRLLFKSQGQERLAEVIAGRPIEFESGTESDILNPTDRELRFSVMQSKKQ